MDKNRFRAACVRMGKTQTNVAEELGMSPPCLRFRINNDRFTLEELKRLYGYLNVTTAEFMSIFFGDDFPELND